MNKLILIACKNNHFNSLYWCSLLSFFCLMQSRNMLVLCLGLGRLKTMNASRIYMVNPKKVIPLHVYGVIL
jgi:hypothetical protein